LYIRSKPWFVYESEAQLHGVDWNFGVLFHVALQEYIINKKWCDCGGARDDGFIRSKSRLRFQDNIWCGEQKAVVEVVPKFAIQWDPAPRSLAF
jgi:hypothetical protein